MIELKKLPRYKKAIEEKGELIKRMNTPRRRVIFYEKVPPYNDNVVIDEHIIYTAFYNQFRADMVEVYPDIHYTISDATIIRPCDFNTMHRKHVNDDATIDCNNYKYERITE